MTGGQRPGVPRLATAGEALTGFSGLLLAFSSFLGWYSFRGNGITVSVIGWHTGTLGKLVFFAGLAVLLLLALRATGFELPPAFPTGAAAAAIGALATIFVSIRLIDVPEGLVGAGRGIGVWISLASGLAVVASGLFQASEEL